MLGKLVEVGDFMNSGLMRGFVRGWGSGCKGGHSIWGRGRGARALMVLRVYERFANGFACAMVGRRWLGGSGGVNGCWEGGRGKLRGVWIGDRRVSEEASEGL